MSIGRLIAPWGGKGLGGRAGRLVAAHDDAAGVEIVVKRLGFPQELGAEEDVFHAQLFADPGRVADRHRRLDDDHGLFAARGRAASDQHENAFHGRAVKAVRLHVVIGGDREDDERGVRVGRGGVRAGRQMKDALAFPGLLQIALDLGVADRGAPGVDHIGLRGCGRDGRNVMMLRKEDGQRQADIAGAGDGDLQPRCRAELFGRGAFDEQLRRVEAQRAGQRLELIDRRDEVLRFEPREQRAVDAGEPGKLFLCDPFFLSARKHGFGQQRQREFLHGAYPRFLAQMLCRTNRTIAEGKGKVKKMLC